MVNAKTKTYQWISWYQPTDDHRPLTFPPNDKVLGWWCTGQRGSDGASTMVAMIDVENKGDAEQAVLKDWPEAEWRFCEDRDHLRLSDRFPLDGWAKDRFEETSELEKL